ncbi:hypothetical protein [Actinoplanes aureus]|uniref:Uncharacterized protein n=1 Tax=Actinoplanes aureus TaxID=2792083 RepID=A0A931C6C5_9ACTN|nr:hypothetical protein [Actinoplanes aureus]MBG0564234.1 hypothetical protein [Actinoplanes aureus]
MSRAKYEIDPRIAAIKARDAVLAAGRYSGRKAVIVGTEGARRTGGAWTVLRYGPPPSRRRTRSILLGTILVAGAVGAATVLVVQRGVAAWRSTDPEAGSPAPADLNSAAPVAAPEGASQAG